MTIEALQKTLTERGIKLGLNPDNSLKVVGDKQKLTPQIVGQIRDLKADLVSWLQAKQSAKLAKIDATTVDGDKVVCSFAQRRLWFIDSLQGASPEYNMPIAFHVKGMMNVDVVNQVFNTIIERHQILRSVYVEQNGQALQHIRPMSEVNFALEVVDFSQIESEALEQKLEDAIEQEAIKPFDLSTDLMCRGHFFKTSDNTGVMMLNMHHIASDGWSMNVLVKEFFALFQAFSNDNTSAGDILPPLAIQYSDFAKWQRKHIEGEVLDGQISYWQKQLDQLPAVHSLQLDKPRPKLKQYQGQVLKGQLPANVAKDLLAVAKHHDLTPFMLNHGILALMLSRHSNSHDIVIGSPVANRMQAELEPLIGFFVNNLVLRVDTNQSLLSDYFADVKRVHLEAQANQDVSFEQLVEHLNVPRSNAHSPLFQIMLTTNTDFGLTTQNVEAGFELPDLSVSVFARTQVQAKFDLTVDINISEHGVGIEWQYDVALFDASHMAQFNQHLCQLMQSVAACALDESTTSQTVTSLAMQSEAELSSLLADCDRTYVNYGHTDCLHQLFEQQVEKTPHQVAVRFGDQQLTYQQLNHKANQLAGYLREHHQITPDTLVGLCFEHSIEVVIAIWAVLKSGGAYVPLDPSYPQERLNYMFDDAKLKVILSHHSATAALASFTGVVVTLDDLLAGQTHDYSHYSTDNLEVADTGVQVNHLAYVIYTSGSTGQPKGVMIEHKNLINYMLGNQQNYFDSTVDGSLIFSSLSFDLSLPSLYLPLLNGLFVELVDNEKFLSPKVGETLLGQSPRLVRMTPSHAKLLLIQAAELANQQSDSAHTFVVGGEALEPQLAMQLLEHFPNASLYNHYGPSEATIGCTSHRVTRQSLQNEVQIPIGLPMANVCVYIFDDGLNLVPHGVVGELYIGGEGLARGYFNQQQMTASRFIDNPFYDEDVTGSAKRLYRTGDLVRYLPDGNLTFIGRADDQVKIRGFRIELGEIENQLNALSMVDSTLVMVTNVADSQQLVSYVKLKTADAQSDGDKDIVTTIKAQLGHKLPEYMVPSVVMLIDDWPLTPNGKINRKALPQPDATAAQAAYSAPQTTTEQQLTDIWGELLNIDANNISRDAEFFQLGGHSLLVVRLQTELRSRFEVSLTIREVFDTPKLSELALLVDNGTSSVKRPEIVAMKADGHFDNQQLPISFAQQRLWFIDSLQGGSSEYNMPSAFYTKGAIDLLAVKHAFTTIIERHQVLRTVYLAKDGGVVQQVRPMDEIDFTVTAEDFTHLSGQALSMQVETTVQQDISKPFDLSGDLMLRVSYIKTQVIDGQEQGVMLFNMHHIASDGWSMEVLIKEFAVIYQAYIDSADGHTVDNTLPPHSLPSLKVQYSDYAHWQREHMSAELFQTQLDYWQQQLAELPSIRSLPLDFDRPTVQQHVGKTLTYQLPAVVAQSLLAVAKQFKLTPFMLLHGALSLLLSRHANNSDVVIGTPVANRLDPAVNDLIGFFVNTLVLRVNTNQSSIADYFAHIRQVHLDAQQHQDVPFEQLVDYLKAPRSTAHSPLFQIMLTTNTDYGIEKLLSQRDFSLAGIECSAYESKLEQAKFDLNIELRIGIDGMELDWNYDVDLFSQSSIELLNQHLCCLLESIAQLQDKPVESLSQLNMLSEHEQNHLLFELNQTDMTYQRDKCIHQLFEQQVALNPTSTALVYEGKNGQAQLTYQQLNQQANQLADLLITEHQVQPNALVGLCIERSFEMIISVLAIMKAGACYVPFDLEHGAEVIASRMVNHNVNLTLLSDSTHSLFSADVTKGINVSEFLMHDRANFSDTNPVTAANEQSLIYAMSSSGTTGKPKLIGLPHIAMNNLIASIVAENDALAGANRVIQFASVGFDMSFTDLALALLHGGSLHLIDESTRFDVNALTQIIQTQQLNVLNLPASMVKVMADIASTKPIDLSSVKAIISTAEKLDITENLKQFFQTNPQMCLINHFGPTETHVCTTYNLAQNANDWPKEVPIGKPIGNTQCYVLDASRGLVAKGAEGELYVAGDCLAEGYLGNREMTDEKFVELDLAGKVKVRAYRTGDLVKWQGEQLFYAGRADDQVKVNGYRIELEDVKLQLLQHPQIENAIVLHDKQNQHLVGYYCAQQLSSVDLQDYLNSTLPFYMVPKYLVPVEAFEFTVNGKIDKRALPTLDVVNQQQYVAPTSDCEIALVDIWASLLNIEPSEISTSANFFDVGGNSIMLIKALHQIQQHFDVAVSVEHLYQHQQLAALGRFIEEELAIKQISVINNEVEEEQSQWEI